MNVALLLASILVWVTAVVVSGGPSRAHVIATVVFLLMITACGIAVFIADRKDQTSPPPWSECLFRLPGPKLVEVCVLAAVFGMAFGVAFAGLASLVIVNGNPTAAIAPPWSAVLEVAGVITLILAAVVYWRLVYHHLKRSVQRRLTRATPAEQPTIEP